MIDCREAVGRMWAYLEQGLDAEGTHELDAHLETCRRCCGELEFSRQLRSRVVAPEPLPLPDDLRLRIERLLAAAEQAKQ